MELVRVVTLFKPEEVEQMRKHEGPITRVRRSVCGYNFYLFLRKGISSNTIVGLMQRFLKYDLWISKMFLVFYIYVSFCSPGD